MIEPIITQSQSYYRNTIIILERCSIQQSAFKVWLYDNCNAIFFQKFDGKIRPLIEPT